MRVRLTNFIVSDVNNLSININKKAKNYFVIYIPHKPQKDSVVVSFSSSLRFKGINVELEVTPTEIQHPYLCIWWYAKEDGSDDTGYALQGTGYISLPQDIATMQKVMNFYVHDVSKSIASVLIDMTSAQFLPHIHEKREVKNGLELLQREITTCDEWLSERDQITETADDAGRWQTCSYTAPHPGRYIYLPMWVFAYGAWIAANTTRTKTLEHLLSLAIRRLNLTTSTIDSDLNEIMCEMATVIPLSLQYRPDKSGDQDTEQWISLAMHPNLDDAGMDCDDGAELALRVLYQMQALDDYGGNTLLEYVCKRSREYEFCMCVGTLFTDDQMVWHAFVMGFDAVWLRSRIEKRPEPGSFRPPLLLESTDYLTSDYSFESDFFSITKYDQQPIKQKDIHCKISSSMLKDADQYKHVIAAFTPQFVESHGIGTVFFTEKGSDGKLGASLCKLDAAKFYANTSVEIPLVVEQKGDRKDVLAAVQDLALYLPKAQELVVNKPLPRQVIPSNVSYIYHMKKKPRSDSSSSVLVQPLSLTNGIVMNEVVYVKALTTDMYIPNTH